MISGNNPPTYTIACCADALPGQGKANSEQEFLIGFYPKDLCIEKCRVKINSSTKLPEQKHFTHSTQFTGLLFLCTSTSQLVNYSDEKDIVRKGIERQ